MLLSGTSLYSGNDPASFWLNGVLAEKLWSAIKERNPEKMKKCLEDGAEPNYPDRNGLNFAHAAAFFGYPEVLKVLIESGVDLRHRDVAQTTVAHAAIAGSENDVTVLQKRDRQEVLQLLIDNKVEFNSRTNQDRGDTPPQAQSTPLVLAAYFCSDLALVHMLMKQTTDSNIQESLKLSGKWREQCSAQYIKDFAKIAQAVKEQR